MSPYGDNDSLAKDYRIDAVALAVYYWTTVMDADAAEAAANHREEALLAELRRYEDHVIGGTREPDYSSMI